MNTSQLISTREISIRFSCHSKFLSETVADLCNWADLRRCHGCHLQVGWSCDAFHPPSLLSCHIAVTNALYRIMMRLVLNRTRVTSHNHKVSDSSSYRRIALLINTPWLGNRYLLTPSLNTIMNYLEHAMWKYNNLPKLFMLTLYYMPLY